MKQSGARHSGTYHCLLAPLVDVLPLSLREMVPDFLVLMTCGVKNFFNLIDCDNTNNQR